eukprot:gnl/MRDRNA2_/MRDRNA2_81303_c0_seq7.p1 gnl/MRDRNA2_/MRDRNA2_81303_c0~~gnl/MRDRNA2_/MRDRNA2_81303_c0_seq7.p1  ORF type:complete len:186 (+),score=34.71 gnl/MRDRNA2_/MRDRNA2_81303_c0_seq7:104-661(+)
MSWGAPCNAWGNYLSGDCTVVGCADYNNPDKEGWYSAGIRAVHECISAVPREDKVPLDHVVIFGFSQGAAVALQSALTYPCRLGACIDFCGWLLPGARKILSEHEKSPVIATPFLVLHGTEDNLVGFDCGEDAAARLRNAGADVDFKRYEGLGHGHTWPPDVYCKAIDEFLSAVMSASDHYEAVD